MLRRRDTVAIGGYGVYLQQQSEDLGKAQMKLITDINSIRESYKGIDAENQIKVFLEAALKINNMMSNFDYYAEYMQKLADYDVENINTAKKQFDTLIAEFKPELMASNINLDELTMDNMIVDVDTIGGEENV